jgi:hypothetical protein
MVRDDLTTIDEAIGALRQLPPRELLHAIMQILAELERSLPPTSSSPDFWRGADLYTLAERQGIQPVEDFAATPEGWPPRRSAGRHAGWLAWG